jgi:hypothetical protein
MTTPEIDMIFGTEEEGEALLDTLFEYVRHQHQRSAMTDPDIVDLDELFDALDTIDALRTVEDEEEDR